MNSGCLLEYFLLLSKSMPRLPLHSPHSSWVTVASLFLGGVCGGSVTSAVLHKQFTLSVRPAQTATDVLSSRSRLEHLPSLASVANVASQSVVCISTRLKQPQPSELLSNSDAFKGKEQLQELLRQLFKDRPRSHGESKMGSGCIVSDSGEILTNYHVITGAEEITVRLATQEEYSARAIGVDTASDLALIKITVPYALPTLSLGDSTSMQVGDWVMAIGSPFGLEQTVTTGIISGKGRVIGSGPYDDFIQTDASINPGNSGGPLLNLRGEVVGISTAIFGDGGVNIGIGFATPIDVGKTVIAQLKEHGKVIRGWMGVTVRSIPLPDSPWLSLSRRSGALVTDVTKQGPAEKAGLKIGDIITTYNGRHIVKSHELPLLISRTPVGTDAEISLIRQQKLQTMKVKIELLTN